MKLSIKPIKPKRISDQVFEQIKELITRGEIQPGEQLMPERELAGAMKVSRTTVRDAINKLVAIGFLEQRQGQGTFVKKPDEKHKNPIAIAMDAEAATLEQLLEVRMGLECNAAALAADRADKEDIKFLEKNFSEMQKEILSGNLGTEADVSFHMAIAYATKNPAQIHIMRNFYDFLFYGIRENLALLYEKKEYIRAIIDQHGNILEAIRKRNPEKAYIAMKEHISYVMNFFRER